MMMTNTLCCTEDICSFNTSNFGAGVHDENFCRENIRIHSWGERLRHFVVQAFVFISFLLAFYSFVDVPGLLGI